MHRRFASLNGGFTLVEVTVAIALLLVVALSAGAFAIQSLGLAAQQQRAQVAVTVAGERMEQVQRLTSSNAQPTALVAGRGETAVANAWVAAVGVPGIGQTYPAWGTVGPETVPLTQTSTRSGSNYTSTVLVGTCYQPVAGGTCTKISGSTTDPGPTSTAATGKSRLLRVIVTVTYAGECASGAACRYTTAALFDTKGDLTWQTN